MNQNNNTCFNTLLSTLFISDDNLTTTHHLSHLPISTSPDMSRRWNENPLNDVDLAAHSENLPLFPLFLFFLDVFYLH